ncbi:PREDICTED: uncharacterized protein LOC104591520 [Nelumbo nucifera]|uniref:Uncharacterized protein LOC104591520 n=2 Tax=Nelumbo nucifera TaxID=4432 RepID=A0A1U7ZBW3_NELNU|nr:PREDICTED: uncharacterized protein LOC104591520 [Nelumbo nucifera]XP_010248680.1 PREDICTED: uncharacterized protein LOC104591520 [Nelumbo nucifera]DAD30774.1 TPA_asm: hypothetical protein HUJ06_009625 [Nelumbo nucifera]
MHIGTRKMAGRENEHEQSEATLKLTVIGAEGLKGIRFLGRMKSFTVAWVDPQVKRSTRILNSSSTSPIWNEQLSFPLSYQTLQNPNSRIMIQVLSPSFLVHNQKVIGSTVLSLSQIQYEGELFTLQLWRPSGRAQGLIRVSACIERIPGAGGLYPLPLVGCVTGIPVVDNNTIYSFVPDQTAPMEIGSVPPVPSAPPMPPAGGDVRKNIFIGFLSGAVAVILLGLSASIDS